MKRYYLAIAALNSQLTHLPKGPNVQRTIACTELHRPTGV